MQVFKIALNNPTLSQIQVDVEGYDKPLSLFNVTLDDGSHQLAEIKE